MIDKEIKLKCLELCKEKTQREVYESYFKETGVSDMTFRTFRRRLADWREGLADDKTLMCGTYPRFVAKNATVQVNAQGDIIQAWIKQGNGFDLTELIEAIKTEVKPLKVNEKTDKAEGMLEIPLFDMHFPLHDHKDTLSEILPIIRRGWEEVNIVIGQDLFHNDDFRGRTSSGRPIERVDIAKAWVMASAFWYSVIEESILNSNSVKITYSKGNHDETLAWAFVQMLKVKYPQVSVDDSMKQRKCILWNGCFIGITHGVRGNNHDLRGQFTIDFPTEFSQAKVREIHTGHLHHEKEADIYGVMVRRLARNGATDEWSDDEGFVGAHKRFMLFEWRPDKLKAIYYI